MAVLRALLAFLVTISLVACGGSGDDDDVTAVVAVDTGSVALLVSDAPLEGLEALWVTITGAELVAEDGSRVALWSGSRRVNLLEFEEQEFMLALRDGVPTALYDKIRLSVEDPAIEPNAQDLPVRIPGNGKLDLVPMHPFRVRSGGFLTIRIDFDARNAVHVVETGSGRILVRPVIHVAIEENFPVPIDLADFRGTVISRDDGDGSLRVDVDVRVGDVTVATDAETTIFDFDLATVGLAVIERGDRVLVRGSLDARRHVIADVIFRGDPLRLAGAVPNGTASAPFDFLPDAGQAIAGTIDATLVPGARAYLQHGPEIVFDELEPGARARLTGRFFALADLFEAGMIDVELPRLAGTIAAVDLASSPHTLTVRVDDADLETVAIDDQTEIRLPRGRALDEDDLVVGRRVRVKLDGDLGDLPYATTVTIVPERFEGRVAGVDLANRELLISPDDTGNVIALRIDPDATILLVEDGGATRIELDDLLIGDTVDALGLSDARGDPVIHALLVGL